MRKEYKETQEDSIEVPNFMVKKSPLRQERTNGCECVEGSSVTLGFGEVKEQV